MIIDNLNVQITRFQSLYEFLKVITSHYILKYELDKDLAIYYFVAEGPNFVTLAFCLDKNFKNENIKIENKRVFDTDETSGTTVVTAEVLEDSLLEQILYYIDKQGKKT